MVRKIVRNGQPDDSESKKDCKSKDAISMDIVKKEKFKLKPTVKPKVLFSPSNYGNSVNLINF